MSEKEVMRILAKARFKFRSDTFTNWATKNPILLSGEFGVVTGLNEVGDGKENKIQKVKIGDGVNAWNELNWWYGSESSSDSIVVDQTYNPESENAQSGKAVAEAVKDFVKNTDYANEETAGVVKVATPTQYFSQGIIIDKFGTLKIDYANEDDIDREAINKPITPQFLKYAVKSVGDGYYVTEKKLGYVEDRISETDQRLTSEILIERERIDFLNENLGDIETALDNIIAIQNSLIGGDSV